MRKILLALSFLGASFAQASSPVIWGPSGAQLLTAQLCFPDTTCITSAVGSSGISSLNGLLGMSQTFATGTSGTDFGISSAGSVHTFNLPTASATNRGALSSSDWSLFNSKQPAGVYFTTIGALDGQAANATGLAASGATIYAQSADPTHPGLMTTANQSFTGQKDFQADTLIADGTGAQATIGASGSTGVHSINGGVRFTTRSVSASFTIDATQTDYIILVDTSSAVSITFPVPAGGRVIIIKDKTGNASTNNITLLRHGTEKFEGVASSALIQSNFGSRTIVSDGTDWYFI